MVRVARNSRLLFEAYNGTAATRVIVSKAALDTRRSVAFHTRLSYSISLPLSFTDRLYRYP